MTGRRMDDYLVKANNMSKRFPEVITLDSVPLTGRGLEDASTRQFVLEGSR
jgi:hypothetical protein